MGTCGYQCYMKIHDQVRIQNHPQIVNLSHLLILAICIQTIKMM